MTELQNDPRTYVRILWRWKFLFLAVFLLVPTSVYLVTSSEAKIYGSSVLIQVQPQTVDNSLFSTAPAATPDQSLQAVARTVTTPAVAGVAASKLHPPPADPGTLLSRVTATADTSTGFLSVQAEDKSPQRAADIANVFAAAVATIRTRQAVSALDATIRDLQTQLGSLPRGTPGRSQLAVQIASVRALRASQATNVQVIERAVPHASPVAPRVTRATVLAGIVGLLLALGAVILAQAADQRVRRPEDLESMTGLPLLGLIPRSAFGGEVAPLDEEAFQMLRSALTYFNVDRPLSSVLISSPVRADGKTTVATRLAIAVARAGRVVILVDADLRSPAVAQRLGLKSNVAGLGPLLSGKTSLERTLIDYPLGKGAQGRLRVLPSGGKPPPNPSELMASERMRDLLDHLGAVSDLVIIDTNPLLLMSDSLPLLDAVSGIVMVARLNRTPKDAITRYQRTIANTRGTILGVVATGATTGLTGRYGLGYRYRHSMNGHASSNGSNGHGRVRFRTLRRPGSRAKPKA